LLGLPVPSEDVAAQPDEPLDAVMLPAHPDLMLVQPPADKRVLPIEQVREMIAFLQLTAHQGGAKVALLSPAEAMSRAAANSLLKTLEEPPAGCHLLLVAERPGSLPPTVVSRCQHVRIALPRPEELASWSGQTAGEEAWQAALDLAGGSPLLARSQLKNGFVDEAHRLEADLQCLQAGRSSPLSVARRWAKLETGSCLDWLYRRTASDIRALLESGPESRAEHLQKPPEGLNMERLFTYLREIAELRRLLGSGVNEELNLARLLGQWHGRTAGSSR
jgi:DNA polymerase-3 subunit delta'